MRLVIQYNKYLLNGQNQEMELFSGTKVLPNLEFFSGLEGVLVSLKKISSCF